MSKHCTLNILLLGDTNVGKTCILYRYTDNTFSDRLNTVGIDFKEKKIKRNEKDISLKIWDTAGAERFRSLTTNYYKNSDGVFVIYDVGSQNSFNAIEYWIKQIRNNVKKDIRIILLANKCDDEVERKISTDEGKIFSNKYNLKYFETSALKGTGINESFDCLVDEILIQKGNKVNNGYNLNNNINNNKVQKNIDVIYDGNNKNNNDKTKLNEQGTNVKGCKCC